MNFGASGYGTKDIGMEGGGIIGSTVYTRKTEDARYGTQG
jgi:hypothetical protein